VDKVLFLSGTTRGGALEGICRAFAPILKEMDLEMVEISLARPETLLPFLQSPDVWKVQFVLSCAGMGMELAVNHNGQKINVWQDLGLPFVTLHGDSPSYFFDRHKVLNSRFISLYAFAEHLELRRRLPEIKGPTGIVLPILLDQIPVEALDLKAKREGTLLFLKNGRDPAEIRTMWMGVAPQVRKALFELVDELERDFESVSGNRIDDLVTEYFAQRNFDIEQMMHLRLFFIAQLDDYIRAVKYVRMAEWLMDFPIQVRGNNWGHVDFTGKKATYVDDCNYTDSVGLIRRSLGTIDLSPNTASMPHDRVMRAFGSHTVCLTNGDQTFMDGLPYKDEVTYSFSKESVQSTVAGLLANKCATVDKGIAVAAAFKEQFPPTRSFERMLDYAAFARLDQTKVRPAGFQDFFVWPPTP
jgi:hypothetical protein